MKITNLCVGQLVSDGASIAEVQINEQGVKYYEYVREQEGEDETDDSIIFVTDLDDAQFN